MKLLITKIERDKHNILITSMSNVQNVDINSKDFIYGDISTGDFNLVVNQLAAGSYSDGIVLPPDAF